MKSIIKIFPMIVFLIVLSVSNLLAQAQAQAQDKPQTIESNPSPAPTLQWSGDLRYRLVQQKEGSYDSRLYQQLRARLGLDVKIDSRLSTRLRLATATSGISSNQLLGDRTDPGMARRSFGIDQAFGAWKFSDELKIKLGRQPRPFFSVGDGAMIGGSQLIFDGDLAFEGLSFIWSSPTAKTSGGFGTLSAFIISENYDAPTDTVDTGMASIEMGYRFKQDEKNGITVHLARHHFLNVAGRNITNLDRNARIDSLSAPSDRYRGNSVYAENPLAATKTYLMSREFTLTNLGAEWRASMDAFGLVLFFDAVRNDHGGSESSAIETGLAVNRGDFEVLLAGSLKEGDSVLGAFSDSDFSGGGTDTRGAKLGVSYRVSEFSEIALTSFFGTRGIASTPRNFNGQFLDFSLNY